MTTFLVTIPIPPRQLSPNFTVGSRGGRMAKAAKTRQYRQLVGLLARDALDEFGRTPRWKRATVRARFVVKDRRRRDADNALASLKAAFDGLRDAGVIEDDSGLRHEPLEFVVGRRALWPYGCVDLEIEERA